MRTQAVAGPPRSSLQCRLSRLSHLDEHELDSLRTAEREQRRSPARREVVAEGEPVRERRALLSGWACRQRILADGRRQIIGFLLPGDLIGMGGHRNPTAPTSILAITEVVTCLIPDAGEDCSALSEAYAVSAALDEHYAFAHITRLGRLNAQERLADWFLETQDRLVLAGLAADDQFPLPLTQELLADALGLTSVHVNRSLRALRDGGLLTSRSGIVSFPNRIGLQNLVGYRTACVSS